MTTADFHFESWLNQAIRPVIREVLRDELADNLPNRPIQAPGELSPSRKPLNLKEAADFLGLAEQTLYQRVKKVPHTKRFGRLYFFEDELLDYLKTGQNSAVAQ
jgi:predicted DNA-binding transcriptional regulator AlpA